MHAHQISRVVLAVSAIFFFVSLETFAQEYTAGVAPASQPPAVSNTAPLPSQAIPVTPPGPLLPTVTVEDLAAAGFTNPTPQPPSGNAFLPPVSYFRVKESVATAHPEWGTAANVVAVSIMPIADQQWAYNNGQLQTVDLAGRVQARVSRPGLYIVATGSSASPVVALLKQLQKR